MVEGLISGWAGTGSPPKTPQGPGPPQDSSACGCGEGAAGDALLHMLRGCLLIRLAFFFLLLFKASFLSLFSLAVFNAAREFNSSFSS